jgi:hypothetical protein
MLLSQDLIVLKVPLTMRYGTVGVNWSVFNVHSKHLALMSYATVNTAISIDRGLRAFIPL